MTINTALDHAKATDSDDHVDVEQLESDLQQRAPRVISHMNDDHEDSLRAYVLAFSDEPRCTVNNIQSAKLTCLDRFGFLLCVTITDGTTTTCIDNVRVPYQGVVKSSKDLHMEAVSMHKLAYNKLGMRYKLQNGYYTRIIKMVSTQLYKKTTTLTKTAARSSTSLVVVLGIAAVAAAAGVSSIRTSRKMAIR